MTIPHEKSVRPTGRPEARPPTPEVSVIGWREWLVLPDLGVERIKAKVDTGARTSALHAFEIEDFTRDGVDWVRFVIYPIQDDRTTSVTAEAPIHDTRRIVSSNGKSERRPIILTHVVLIGRRWPIELSLTRRDAMGFRMLLGRQAIRKRVLVDPGGSFLGGRHRKRKRKGKT